ncbi:MAG: Mammalian cell entry related domain protein [Gemmatimonadetes bacterium]|nr:Mammalian cell entry related domain protein [Gemmatimonadota bacterium]
MKRSSFITWDQLKVGAMIIVAALIMALAFYKLGKAANLFASRYTLIAYLPNANGLREGGTVMVAGQLAGTVKKIDFLPVDYDTTKNLRLTLQLDEALHEQVRQDSKARLRTMGLLGDKVIDISPGTPKFQPLKDGSVITVAPTLDYEAVLAQAAGAVGDVVSLTHDMKTLTSGIVRGEGTLGQLVTNKALYDQLVSTLGRTNSMLARVQNSQGTIGKLLDDPTMYNHMVAVIGSTDSLVRAMNSNKGTVGKLLHDDSLYTSLVGITHGADSLMKMLTSGQGMAGKMLTDQTLYDQLNKLVTDLSAMLADIRKDPRRYMKGIIKIF